MMRKILILGAGRSSFVLIKYLLDNAADNNWFVRVADFSFRSAQKIVGKTKYGDAVFIDVNNEIQRKKEIKNSDIVISMLPANFHLKVANECVRL